MKDEIRRLLDECEQQIGQLPKPITNEPRIEVFERIGNFCNDLQGAVNGKSKDKALVRTNRTRYLRHDDEIKATEPLFVTHAPGGGNITPERAKNLIDVRAVINRYAECYFI